MYTISKEIQFDAGHRVPLHASKCKNPHGHRYRVVATLEGELIDDGGPESGMVRDFSNVKEVLTHQIHDIYDHGFIVYDGDHDLVPFVRLCGQMAWKLILVPFYPTAECLAKEFYQDIKHYLPNLIRIDVWETPTSCASYEEA